MKEINFTKTLVMKGIDLMETLVIKKGTKKFSVEEFENFIKSGGWKRECFTEEHDSDYSVRCVGSKLKNVGITFGCGAVDSSKDGVIIMYQEGYEFEENEPDTFSTSTEGLNNVWEIKGACIVDEDGEFLDIHDFNSELVACGFSDIDYSHLVLEETEELDFDENSDLETFILDVSYEPKIKFSGELIASSINSPDRTMPDWSGSTGEWEELYVYKTLNNNYICYLRELTLWQDNESYFHCNFCKNLDEVKEFFGDHKLAEELYEDL
jgi:hypothetical protein